MAFAKGYSMIMEINFDGLGLIYIAIACCWTLILGIGVTFLISKRDLPFIRIRNVPLAVSAVATLHVYWVLCMLAYVLQGYFPCSTEFWIMSIYLPLGIALFHACNTQLLHIANLQKRYTYAFRTREKDEGSKSMNWWRRRLANFYLQNNVKRAMIGISFGMVLQLVAATIVFLISRKFHGRFGLTGGVTDATDGSPECVYLADQYGLAYLDYADKWSPCTAAKRIACRRGWEWLPSIIWQFIWSWCYAPYLLWQVKDINDIHGWRKQTTYCCLAGLFATPMWLCSLYLPDMLIINRYYVPPLWFAPSIFLVEAFLIFIPCWQILKHCRGMSEHLQTIREWQHKSQTYGSSIGAHTADTNPSQMHSTVSTTSSRRGEMYTMQALESALRTNPRPLLEFAAFKDFSGENVSFLEKILEWKRNWSPSTPTRSGFLRRPSVHDINSKPLQRQQFKRAVDIYASCISLKHSNYPINISHILLKELEAIFEPATRIFYSHKLDDASSTTNSATPFEAFTSKVIPITARSPTWSNSNNKNTINHPTTPLHSHATNSTTHTNTIHTLSQTSQTLSNRNTVLQSYELSTITDTTKLPDCVSVPDTFGPETFDRVETHIKYIVLTNTWPKFVNAGFATIDPKTDNCLAPPVRRRMWV